MKGLTTRTIGLSLAAAICLCAPPATAFLSGDNNAAIPAPTTDPDAFDGRWTFTSAGCRYTGSLGAVIKHGRVIVRGGSGQVNADGIIHTVGAGGGMTLTAEGRLENETGSGTFSRSDGCLGTWIAIKRR